jgi:hypothetical protein
MLFLPGAVLFTCTPPPPLVPPDCPEPLWKEYSSFEAFRVKKETARLEALLEEEKEKSLNFGGNADTADTTSAGRLSTLEIVQRLFELSIHRANPDYNIDNIFRYVSFLYQHGGPDSLRYRNWGRAVQEQKSLLRQRDSLANVISAISREDKKESRSVENLKKELRGYVKQCDSLTSVISIQKETIMKLQKLDVMMEQQRSKIQ